MQDRKTQDQFYFVNRIEKNKRKNALCIIVLDLYYLMLLLGFFSYEVTIVDDSFLFYCLLFLLSTMYDCMLPQWRNKG